MFISLYILLNFFTLKTNSTRMHSSRMHTVRSSGRPGGSLPGTPPDQTPPGPDPPGPDPPRTRHPPVNRITDTLQKHYLPATWFAGGNNCIQHNHPGPWLRRLRDDQHLPWHCLLLFHSLLVITQSTERRCK